MSTGVCNLMSINLVKFVKIEKNKLEFNYEEFAKAVSIAVRFSDNINDISNVPLDAYKKSMKEKRRIGVGVLGLGSLHFMLGIHYGSNDSLELIEKIFKTKAESEIIASCNLGSEKGNFGAFDEDEYFNTEWWKTLRIDEDIKKLVKDTGCMRNSHRSANAPTGNMSLYAKIVSGGIEPIFMKEYTRWAIVNESKRYELLQEGFKFPNVRLNEWFETEHLHFSKAGDEEILIGSFNGNSYQVDKNRGLTMSNEVIDYGWLFVKEHYTAEQIAEMESRNVFKTTEELSTTEHVNPLKIIAHYTDMNSSKTVNLPSEYPYDKFKDLYMDAWRNNIKGITTYRAGSMTSVLEATADKSIQKAQDEIEDVFAKAEDSVITEHVKLPDEYFTKGYTIRDSNKKKWYVNVAFSDNTCNRPFALFVQTNCKEDTEVADSTVEALMTLAKICGILDLHIDNLIYKMRKQSNITKIARSISLLLRHNVKILDVVNVLDEGNYPLSSFPFHIKRLLKKFVSDGTTIDGSKGVCPECSSQLVFQEGCLLCPTCGHSKCS